MTGGPPCPGCATVLPPAARFCPGCGLSVGAGAATEERRLVTVVFADLEGFTALAEQRDPESVKELLDACFSALVPVVAEHGGHVDKIIGDELMAVFGAPLTHEDDPERAVRAALALATALAGVGPGLRLRVGVNTGEVLAGAVGPSAGYTVTGDVVNTAHRLVSAAAPGEVLVGDRTRAATEDAIDYELRGDLDLRGKAEPVRVWVARGVRIQPGHRSSAASTAPFVGRSRELAELTDRVREAFAAGRPEVITLVGEPGVGKSRLAMELAVRLATKPATARVLSASCPPYGPGGDLAPLADLVRAGLGISPSAERRVQLDALAAGVGPLARASGADDALLRSRLELLLGLGPLPTRSADPDAGPPRAGIVDHQLSAVRSVLSHLSSAHPLLLVVDDLHWAGPQLLRFLAQVPERLVGHPVVVLALAREDLLERQPRLAAGAAGRRTRSLDALSDDAVVELATLLIDDQPAGPGEAGARLGPIALDRLVVATGGNPLVLEQLVPYLVESGALVREGRRWQWSDGPAGNESALPDGIRSLIGARLDGLPPDERVVVSHASVLGHRFWRQALADLTDVDDLDGVLARLEARGLTEPVADGGEGDHAFRHVLTRDVAYAALPIGDRAVRHARVAAWLDRHLADRPGAGDAVRLGQIAHHYERAVVLARSVDHTEPGLADAAFESLVRAARDARGRAGLRQADHWYRRARDVGSADQHLLLDVVAEHGGVHLELRHLDEARATFEDLWQRSEGVRPHLAASALAHLGAVARLGGDRDLARERFEAAATRSRELDDVDGQIDALRLEGWSEIAAGRPRAALPRLERALAMEDRLGEARRRGETLQYLGWCEFLSGEVASARRHLWAAMEHSMAVGDQGALGWCFGLLAFSHLQAGEVARSLDLSRNLREVARRNGDPWGEWTCATLEAASLLALGEGERALELATEAQWRFEELEDPWGLALARVVRAQCARLTGDAAGAREVLVDTIALARTSSYTGEDARLLAELARVELDDGDHDEAERRARAALALVRAGIGDHESGLRSLLVLAEVERHRDEPGRAELLLEEAVAPRDPEDRTDGWRAAALVLARLRLDAGDVARARALLDACDDPASEEVRTVAAVVALRAELPATA